MDATVSPWSTLQHLFQRWQSRAARSAALTQWPDKVLAFFRQHRWLTIVLGAALSAILGAYCMYKFVAADMPALRAEYQRATGETYAYRSDLASVRSQFEGHVGQEKASRDEIANSLRALDANLVVLGQKMDGRPLAPHEARTVLATVREISITEAAKLESIATIGGVIAEEYTPMLALAKKEESLREFATFFGAATPSVQPAYLGKLLLIRNGTWHVMDRQILFKWDGGSARLRATSDLPQSEIVRKAELFNSVSRAVTHAAGIAPTSYAPPPPKAASKSNAVTRANGASNAQRRPQPPRRVEVVKRPEAAPVRRPAGVAHY